MKRRLLLSLAISIILAGTLFSVSFGAGAAEPACCDPTPATPIPQGLLYPLVPACQKYIRDWDRFPEGYSNPVEHLPIPEHPYMAPNGMSNMHNDPYMTDTYEVSGPLGSNPQVNSTYYGLAECVTVTFDSQGRIVTVLGGFGAPTLLLLDPDTLDELARYVLPSRPWYWIFDEIGILEDPSGGAYFYLDHEGNVVVTTHDYRILVVSVPLNPCDGFQVVQEYDLSDHVLPQPWPNRDKVGPAIPDWGGEFYWYTTRYGMVGTVEVGNPTNIHTVQLPGEQIQNSPAVGEDGFYVITDHAMYRFTTDENGNISQEWRTEYDRGTRKKPGMITQGSGTTPNLFGDLVAIADNADPKMNVIFLRRSNGFKVCHPIPVFEDGESCTENALIGVARKDGNNTVYSVIVENNYGYENFLASTTFGKSTVGGITRIDVTLNRAGQCIQSESEVWASDEISCTPVPKMSLANGLVYLYTKPHTCLIDKWYFTAVDFETGETVYKILTGTGLGYNNNWAPITLGPGGGTAYVGTLAGMISVRDT